ncbi:hypothetical protein HKG47_000600 [Salmonella enterica subsp. enterica serovar Ruiru]|uniref:hypothetical protein n=1 Tax=Salmonella enterica TaxID=28901 RepID=UPI000406DDA7|nr:hypothetical protein [Salmonella enterica subsp. enterica serovar Minnesota]EEO9960258.1 hypothetical protein [Salmonella enterica]EEP4060730.1 hypothetical protein [Salmonella enterica subsp. enterica serovar Ruiru]EHG0013300.1 hypothetical protein [Salmonella enterica subsp. enterica serovar Magwa]EEO3482167.1 hypothetical protein [Salmonella enterica subsp. enterica serovar Minnesota]
MSTGTTYVFPAPAGINRGFSPDNMLSPCVPRASGDKPRIFELASATDACSPRQRG